MKGTQLHRFLDNEDAGMGGEQRIEEDKIKHGPAFFICTSNLLLCFIFILFRGVMAAFILLSNCWLYPYHLTAPLSTLLHTRHILSSDLVPDALSRGIFNGPRRPDPQLCTRAFMKAIISVYSLLLRLRTSPVPRPRPRRRRLQPASATLAPDFNVMGNVMVLSLCSIVNSVTVLWGIN